MDGPAAFLIRPDGYVGLSASPTPELATHLADYLALVAPPPVPTNGALVG